MRAAHVAALALAGGTVAAQEIEPFGEARLGLGYNVDNDGELTGAETVRALSQVRFGVALFGEAGGIAFGAEVLADEAQEAEGGAEGQVAGVVFAEGDWGGLSFGDVGGADAERVGDLNEVGLTCLGCQNETPFISGGGEFGDDADDFAPNPFALPTVRYDHDAGDFGVSLSTNRDLTDVAVGAGYGAEIAQGFVFAGVGYSRFDAFTVVEDPELALVDTDGDGAPDAFLEVEPEGIEVGGGEQWSASVGAELGIVDGTIVWTRAETGDAGFGTAGVGVGVWLEPWSFDGYLMRIVAADGDLAQLDGLRSYGLGATYELGGDAWIEGGVASVWDIGAADDGRLVADFGIGMAF